MCPELLFVLPGHSKPTTHSLVFARGAPGGPGPPGTSKTVKTVAKGLWSHDNPKLHPRNLNGLNENASLSYQNSSFGTAFFTSKFQFWDSLFHRFTWIPGTVCLEI